MSFFLRSRKDFIMSDRDSWFFSFWNLITDFYFIKVVWWLKTKGLPPGGGLSKGLYVEAFAKFLLLMDFDILGFKNFSTQVNFQLERWQYY